MKKFLILTVVVLFVLAGVILLWPSSSSSTFASDLDGKTIFTDNNCNMCHSVAAAGIEAKIKSEKMQGPDLAGITEEKDAEVLTDYLRKETEMNGKKHQKAFTGSDEELGALLNWLGSLEKAE